jgi:hypothetical protein
MFYKDHANCVQIDPAKSIRDPRGTKSSLKMFLKSVLAFLVLSTSALAQSPSYLNASVITSSPADVKSTQGPPMPIPGLIDCREAWDRKIQTPCVFVGNGWYVNSNGCNMYDGNWLLGCPPEGYIYQGLNCGKYPNTPFANKGVWWRGERNIEKDWALVDTTEKANDFGVPIKVLYKGSGRAMFQPWIVCLPTWR